MSQLNANAQPYEARAATNGSRLNAFAQPFMVARTRADHHARRRRAENFDDPERCLFMTFSSGYPLTRDEIVHFFTRGLGESVDRVYVQHGQRKEPEFGKITFTTSTFPTMALLDKEVVKIWVNNKPIWLKKYVPRSQRRMVA